MKPLPLTHSGIPLAVAAEGGVKPSFDLLTRLSDSARNLFLNHLLALSDAELMVLASGKDWGETHIAGRRIADALRTRYQDVAAETDTPKTGKYPDVLEIITVFENYPDEAQALGGHLAEALYARRWRDQLYQAILTRNREATS